MAELLLGKDVNADLNGQIVSRIEKLAEKQVVPQLAIIRVGGREDDLAYEHSVEVRFGKLGVKVRKDVLPVDCAAEDVIKAIHRANDDKEVHGVLLFRPLPKGIDEEAVIRELDPAKDMDGITTASIAGVFSGNDTGYPPCTAQAVMEILRHYEIELCGKKAVVIGRSMVIGKPVAMMLLRENATVTICHTKTVDMPSVVREADIVVVAAGHAGVVNADFVREGQIVIDVGINVNEEGKLCGDVDFTSVEPVVAKITPVPRGVGSVTTSVLAEHVVSAAEKTV
uniref:bifunctional 5,10-methylenetetrahydrofolate dehydrogenase/5,10-methenyltetrahydrofolate cyclohydrolase n=1 Tax=Eubacterium cellulosolvens TaxID=29322 RepID=UPI0004850069|nr:bifunctional 5,10-methylenetetrahydrofolate dehydrogenase/5,10-methenyltetrahydrofolate cyclohydrolase [[Eubacterium] cellulosolvens]